MFGVTDNLADFRGWISTTKKVTEHDHRLCFFVAYASMERYLFRTGLALLVFSESYTADARKRLKKYNLWGLLKLCSNPKQGGNPEAIRSFKALGLDDKKVDVLRNRRNGIAHGFDLGKYTDIGSFSDTLWTLLHDIADIGFGEGHPQAPYRAWQKLPSKRRAKQRT